MVDAVRKMLAAATARVRWIEPSTAYAPSNIALSKYWGKRDAERNLPLNSSVSVSLADWGSRTSVCPSETGQDEVALNGVTLATDSAFSKRALRFADMFRGEHDMPLRIDTQNTIPTAAGLASSASGFAALTQALCGAFGLRLDPVEMSRIARLGSGSAARSFWHGFVRWEKGVRDDGWDSHGAPLDVVWPAFRIAIVTVDAGPKSQGSRDGMLHTAQTSPLFLAWAQQADLDCTAVEQALSAHDLDALGPLVEANALAMHATMLAARPTLAYLTAQTWQVIERLWLARAQGLAAYATMDAGPNVKLIFLKESADDVRAVFPDAHIVAPFAGE